MKKLIVAVASLVAFGTLTIPAVAEQTAAPTCYDMTECRIVIKRLTTEGDNYRSDVFRLEYWLAIANEDLKELNADKQTLTAERDSLVTERDQLLIDNQALMLENERLAARSQRLAEKVEFYRSRLALPDTRCKYEDSRDCVWHAPSSGNFKGRSFYTTYRGEMKFISHDRAARMISFAD